MSRTFRCKPTLARAPVSPRALDDLTPWDRRRAPVGSPQAHVAGPRTRAHRDHPSGRFGVPRWYRRVINGKIKRQQLIELHRARVHNAWDAHSPLPFRPCVRYYRW